MTDPDEAQLSKLAKTMLATPHKNREPAKMTATLGHSTTAGPVPRGLRVVMSDNYNALNELTKKVPC